MTILAMPAGVKFKAVRFGLRTNTQTHTSPLSGTTQTLEMPGAHWVATYSAIPYTRTQAAALQAWLIRLRGASGRFYGYNPQNTALLGSGGGTPKVNGGSQVGGSLDTDGWPADTLVLLAGDEFQIGDELKMVMVDVLTNGSGEATIIFEPPLRTSPADNADIITDTPKCIMRLIDDGQAAWQAEADGFMEITFNAEESFV